MAYGKVSIDPNVSAMFEESPSLNVTAYIDYIIFAPEPGSLLSGMFSIILFMFDPLIDFSNYRGPGP